MFPVGVISRIGMTKLLLGNVTKALDLKIEKGLKKNHWQSFPILSRNTQLCTTAVDPSTTTTTMAASASSTPSTTSASPPRPPPALRCCRTPDLRGSFDEGREDVFESDGSLGECQGFRFDGDSLDQLGIRNARWPSITMSFYGTIDCLLESLCVWAKLDLFLSPFLCFHTIINYLANQLLLWMWFFVLQSPPCTTGESTPCG